jgi:16S rRNA (guanine527-N7)-methyltransferase
MPGRQEVIGACALAPEVVAKLDAYEALLRKWQKAINLVGRSTLDEIWERHFHDSLQLIPLLPEGVKMLVDLGSGAGFPGMVLAIATGLEVHLVESDQRKAQFLREVSRETRTPVRVHAERAERVAPFPADVVTARALAPLPELIDMARRFAHGRTVALFPKGRAAEAELTGLDASDKMRVTVLPSRTSASAAILRIEGIARGRSRSP